MVKVTVEAVAATVAWYELALRLKAGRSIEFSDNTPKKPALPSASARPVSLVSRLGAIRVSVMLYRSVAFPSSAVAAISRVFRPTVRPETFILSTTREDPSAAVPRSRTIVAGSFLLTVTSKPVVAYGTAAW